MANKVIVPITEMIARLPTPTNLSFSFPKDWGPESLGALSGEGWGQKIAGWATSMGESMIGSTVAANISNEQGISLNKREKVTFRTLPFRQVNFEWNLVPKSKEQAQIYLSTIDAFKYYSAPDYAFGETFWDYPFTFKLELKSKGGFVVFRSPELACTDLVVNYTPQGFWSQHEDGLPTAISFSMAFMERELAIRSKLAAREIV